MRSRLSTWLKANRVEIAQAVRTRVHGVSDFNGTDDPDYMEGVDTALEIGLDHGIAVVEAGTDHAPPVPPLMLSQARFAARRAVSIDVVLRRYFAAFSIFGDFVLQGAQHERTADSPHLRRLLQIQAGHFDRLINAVSQAYADEREAWMRTPERRRAEIVQRLLAGEMVELADVNYELTAWHLGLVGTGPDVYEELRGLANAFDQRVMVVPNVGRRDEAWAWLGGRERLDPTQAESELRKSSTPEITIAVGEPGQGISGWRLTHRQAQAALPIAIRGRSNVVRYADVALVASAWKDDLLTASLMERYISPLFASQAAGTTLRNTLRTYFSTDRNIASAAAALGVTRQTVANRLRVIEKRLGAPLSACASEVETAIQLTEILEASGQSLCDGQAIVDGKNEYREV